MSVRSLQLEIAMAFGRAVKSRRVELGLTQEALADKAGFARSFLSGVECGNKLASVASVWKLSKALNCSPSDLWLTAERLMNDAHA